MTYDDEITSMPRHHFISDPLFYRKWNESVDPIILGTVTDVASGTIETGYAPIEALLGESAIYGGADLYDYSGGPGLRVKVCPAKAGSVSVTILPPLSPLDYIYPAESPITRRREIVEAIASRITPGSILEVR